MRDDKPVESLRAGEHGIVILDRTSFYAERGGQIGDRGRLTLEDGSVFDVDDTQYMGEAVAHHGVVKSGEFTVGDRAHGASSTGGDARFGAITRRRTCCSARSKTSSATR